jgi:hypothetical protein
MLFGHTRERNLVYGILIDDDPGSPVTLWSLVERKDELEAVKRITTGEKFMLAMFNEAIVNVCGGLVVLSGSREELKELFQNTKLAGPGESEDAEPDVSASVDRWHSSGAGLTVLSSVGDLEWGPNENVYITNQLQTSRLDFRHTDEGRQQEELATWITDSLHLNGVFQNPVARENTARELCDLLLTHQFGAVLFESKALSILSRSDLPARKELRGIVTKHIGKALRQLAGACRNVRIGTPILARSGEEIPVERQAPPNCVVIIPDLTLLDGAEGSVFADISDFATTTKAFVNILDPSQLFTMMMDSNNLSHRGQMTTPLMAFDYLLIRRFESVIESHDPGVITLCRFSPPGNSG